MWSKADNERWTSVNSVKKREPKVEYDVNKNGHLIKLIKCSITSQTHFTT